MDEDEKEPLSEEDEAEEEVAKVTARRLWDVINVTSYGTLLVRVSNYDKIGTLCRMEETEEMLLMAYFEEK